MTRITGCFLLTLFLCTPNHAFCQEQDFAKQLANPVASLISVPIQANYDDNFNADENGSAWRTNIQPVIPISLTEDMNLISRTILPILDQEDIPVVGSNESGIGDILQSLFFSPKEPTKKGNIWGVGPAILLPTASDSTLGSEKWGVGPTGVILRQDGSWTIGGLANHIESFAGPSDRTYVSSTFLQPFMAYVTKTKTTLGMNSESTYNWNTEKWSIPINAYVYQLFKIGDQLIQAGGGVRYWVESPDTGADDWGLRLQLTFLFPK